MNPTRAQALAIVILAINGMILTVLHVSEASPVILKAASSLALLILMLTVGALTAYLIAEENR